ncbi:hypothetical protein ACMD2_11488 [Ananas comosus]|uniref:Uncharacterized protein n=1 Tax=Ananas comosus TaxID=4615 RepID=A0A199VVT1_ANACO|nr:hypothetical protein ACMD2_11488 [Ananas comosus]
MAKKIFIYTSEEKEISQSSCK